MILRLSSLGATTLAIMTLVVWNAWAQEKPQEKPAVPPEINKPFAKPDLDGFVKKFETESREVYLKREEIVSFIGLKPGMAVADVGAGTGLFTRLFAKAVGSEGVVYAVDISEGFLKHIASESKRLDQKQVRTVLCDQYSSKLEPNSVDIVFVCDTYHHFEHPAKTMASIHQALRDNGLFIIIDFDKHDKASDFIKKHVRDTKAVFFKEIEAAGFERSELSNAPQLKENFVAGFRKIKSVRKAP